MGWTEPTTTEREVKERAKGTEEFAMIRVTGALYTCVLSTPDMIQQMEIIRKLKLKDDDVITVGLQRSGNHWCFEVVNMILKQQADYEKDHFLYHLLEYSGPDVQSKIDEFESPRNLTIHARITKVPEEALQRKTKIVYVFRNPKDVWVSSYVVYTQVKALESRFQGTWDEFVQCNLDDQFINGSWFDHVWATETFMENHPDHPIFILQYEKIKQDPKGVITELCKFLDRPVGLVESIAEATAIQKMKPALLEGKLKEYDGTVMQEGQNELIRKGIVGDWKHWFTVSQNEAFDKLFKEKMAGSKLASLVTPYMDIEDF